MSFSSIRGQEDKSLPMLQPAASPRRLFAGTGWLG